MKHWRIPSQVSMSLCFSSSMSCFGFCIMSMLNFIATDLRLYKIFKITWVCFFGTQCSTLCYAQGDHSPDNVKFPASSQHSSLALGMFYVTHIMPVLVLNTCMGANMELTINSFRQLFPDMSLTFSKIPDIFLTAIKFPDMSRFSRQVITLYAYTKFELWLSILDLQAILHPSFAQPSDHNLLTTDQHWQLQGPRGTFPLNINFLRLSFLELPNLMG